MSRLIPYLLIQQRKAKRNARYRSAQINTRHSGFALLAVFLVALAMLPVIAGFYYTTITRDLPNAEWLEIYLNPENGVYLNPTTIYDRQGETVLYQLQNEGFHRRFLPIDPNSPEFFSPYLVQFTVAEYEADFWTSVGYTNNWLDSTGPQTIAELLVDRLLLWQEPKGLQRNIRMKILAAQITQTYGRTQVLEWFLNSQSYGHYSTGADTAARVYFRKPASQLTMGEAALLVSVSRTPALNPIDAPQAALENQRIFLQKLVEEGRLSKAEYEAASAENIQFHSSGFGAELIANAYVRLVLNDLYDMLGYERVELGGLEVISSLDTDMQAALACTIKAQLNRAKGITSDTGQCEPAKFLSTARIPLPEDIHFIASAVILEPGSGEILALVGDSNETLETNLVSTHQAGSILTPLLAVNAFARGFTLGSQVWDIPASAGAHLTDYSQSAGTFIGPMRLRTALANDVLTPLGGLLEQLGAEIVWQSSDSFGLSYLANQSDPKVLFEGRSANIVEVAQLYATFASLGARNGLLNPQSHLIEPLLIHKVTTTDQILLYGLEKTDTQSILSSQLAYLVHDFLQDDHARRASLGFPNLLEIGRPAGAKYGHTYAYDEVWTAGYTPQYTTVVWVGNEGEAPHPLDVQIAGSVWYAMMQWLHQGLAVETWAAPAGISEREVCALSGLLVTRECPETAKEKFIDGTQPVNFDNLFKSYEINRETGLLATVFTPAELIESRTFMVLPDEALAWAKTSGVELPPKDYDAIQSPSASADVRISAPGIYDFIRGEVAVRGSVSGGDIQSFRIQIGSGLNPQAWFQIGDEQTEAMVNGVLANWDTAAYEDGLYALRLQVIRTGQNIETHTIQVTVDNTPPSVQVLFPRMDQEIPFSANMTTTLQADVGDNTGVARVEWWLDGALAGTSEQAPYSFPAALRGGRHTLQVRVFDLAGNRSDSPSIDFELK